MTLPHIRNSVVGRQKWEPIWSGLFEIKIVLPPALSMFEADFIELSDEITKADIDGALDAAPGTTPQKFLGVTRTFLNPNVDDTVLTISCACNMNLRNDVDNVMYKIFRTWNELGYNINTGERGMKVDYCAPVVTFIQKNKKGDPIRTIIAHDCILTEFNPGNFGKGGHEFGSNDIGSIEFKLIADWWDDVVA